MKKIFILSLSLIICFLANGQEYLKEANVCFDKGDYECAKKNYTLFQTFDGRDMSVQIQKANECLKALTLANGYFQDKEYEKAREKYKLVLDKNPKDSYAKKQYDLCETKLRESFANYTETTNNLNLEMIVVQGDTFTMGCTSEQASDCSDDEKPAHQVTISDFYIGKYEVTQAQWKAVMGNNPSYFKGDNLPVEQVSWNDIQDFLRKLNAQTGKNYRLPTEAEWEYAARGGNKSNHYKYSGSNVVGNVAWYTDNSGNTTHPVGTKSPNELGIFDMSGNVLERCNDWYGTYINAAQKNPQGDSSGSYRVFRGGSWNSIARSVSVSNRSGRTPDIRRNILGFRLACSSK